MLFHIIFSLVSFWTDKENEWLADIRLYDFLMLVSLFPFMTQTDNGSHPAYFTIVYVIYIIVTSRFASLIIKAAYRLNEVKINRHQARKPWDLLAMSVIAIVISSLGYSAYTGIPLLYLPIRSLVTSIVYDED